MRIAPKVIVADEDRKTLQGGARGRSAPVRLTQRAKIVLLAAEGQENKDIAAAVGVTRQLVGRWRSRYVARGLAGIEKDAPGRGRKATARDAITARIMEWTTSATP